MASACEKVVSDLRLGDGCSLGSPISSTTYIWLIDSATTSGWGGGGTQVQGGGGGGGRTCVTYFAEEGVFLFLRPPHVRDFVKEGYFFVPRYEVWGSKSPYNLRNIRGSDAE